MRTNSLFKFSVLCLIGLLAWTGCGGRAGIRSILRNKGGMPLGSTRPRQGLKITTHIETMDSFDWGSEQWDLIVPSYVGAKGLADTVVRSLRPGGMVIVEGFHRDATKTASTGGVVFDTKELLQMFPRLRVVRYEDTVGIGDFGRLETRVVRLAATKP